jgi:hypothetical protein
MSKEDIDKELDDWRANARALVAAGKSQRWEVVKWATAGNLALASVAATKDRAALLPNARWFSPPVAVVALILIVLATKRMNGARNRLEKITTRYAKGLDVIDIRRNILQEQKPDLRFWGLLHDGDELATYALALLLPTAFLWWQ